MTNSILFTTPTSSGSSFIVRLALSLTIFFCPGPLSLLRAQWVTNGTVVSLPEGNVVGIGTAGPAYQLDILSESSTAARGVAIHQYSNDSAAPAITFSKVRGSFTAPAANAVGDKLANLQTAGYDGSGFQYASRILFVVDAPVTSGSAVPTSIQFLSGSNSGGVERMRITSAGNIGIGTTSPLYPLSVNGTIQAKEILVNANWSDYVFDSSYRLASLKEVDAYVSEHHHLPEIPSASEVAEKGISVGEMQAKLLAKIEELTLHMIDAEKKSQLLEQKVQSLQDKLAHPVPLDTVSSRSLERN